MKPTMRSSETMSLLR